tara:strand:- start:243 stop:578 length:336 start_codon:yes stop_codon:yes gene_type:complete
MNTEPDEYGIVPNILPLPAMPNYDIGPTEQQVPLGEYEEDKNAKPEGLEASTLFENRTYAKPAPKEKSSSYGYFEYKGNKYENYGKGWRITPLSKPGTGVTPAANMTGGNL